MNESEHHVPEIDLNTVLQQLQSVYGEEAALNLLSIFFKDTPGLLGKIQKAVDSENVADVKNVVHELKGSCSALKLIDMVAICRQVEAALRDNKRPAVIEAVRRLTDSFRSWSGQMELLDTEDFKTPRKTIGVFLIEDSELTRLALKTIISHSNEFKLVGEAASAEAALPLINSLQPDVAVVDIGLPGMSGIEATREFKHSRPHTKALMLTAHDDDDDMFSSFAAGADGYVVKQGFDPVRLTLAIKTVFAGSCWLDPAIAQRILAVAGDVISARATREQTVAPVEPLTTEEQTVLHLAVEPQVNCVEGVCQVDPDFLSRLNRFAHQRRAQ